MERIDLNEFCGGNLQAQFSNAFRQVIENCMDPAMSAKENREITVKVKFVVGETRDMVMVGVHTTTKLAHEIPGKTLMGIGRNARTGEIVAEEFGDGVRGQTRFDAETGEIFEEHKPGAYHVMPMPPIVSEA